MTGGNKTLLFNAEYYFNVGGPVRVLAFYDAGQVRDIGAELRVEGRHHAAGAARPAAPDRSVRIAVTVTRPGAPIPMPTMKSSADATRSRPRRASKSGSSCRC